MSYAGWSNYETWSVDSVCMNDQGIYNDVREMVNDADDTWDLAQRLSSYMEETQFPELGELAGQLLTAAISQIDWQELAEAWWTDYREAKDDD